MTTIDAQPQSPETISPTEIRQQSYNLVNQTCSLLSELDQFTHPDEQAEIKTKLAQAKEGIQKIGPDNVLRAAQELYFDNLGIQQELLNGLVTEPLQAMDQIDSSNNYDPGYLGMGFDNMTGMEAVQHFRDTVLTPGILRAKEEAKQNVSDRGYDRKNQLQELSTQAGYYNRVIGIVQMMVLE